MSAKLVAMAQPVLLLALPKCPICLASWFAAAGLVMPDGGSLYRVVVGLSLAVFVWGTARFVAATRGRRCACSTRARQ